VRLFVTGLGGYLGHAIAAATPGEVAGTIRHQSAPRGTQAFRVDVRDTRAIAAALREVGPDAVVHTAFVQQGDELTSINVEGSAVVASAARRAGLRLVHVSSDAIFAGELGRPVCEADPPRPTTAYGASKAEAELAVSAAHPEAVIVRTSLIYGGERPSIHELRALHPASAFYSDAVRCPVVAPELAAALIELASLPHVHGPLHVAGPDAVSRLEFARLIVAAYGGDPATVQGTVRPAGYPGDVELDCSRAAAILRTRFRGVREVLAPGTRTL